MSSHEDSADKFCCAGSISSMSKAIKLLLTESVGQCRNILPLLFSVFAGRSVNMEKVAGNIFMH